MRFVFFCLKKQDWANFNHSIACDRMRCKDSTASRGRVPNLEAMHVEVRRSRQPPIRSFVLGHARKKVQFEDSLHFSTTMGSFGRCVWQEVRTARLLLPSPTVRFAPLHTSARRFETKPDTKNPKKDTPKEPQNKPGPLPDPRESGMTQRDREIFERLHERAGGGEHNVGIVDGAYEGGLGKETKKNMFRLI